MLNFAASLIEKHIELLDLLEEEERVVGQKAIIVKYREEIDVSIMHWEDLCKQEEEDLKKK